MLDRAPLDVKEGLGNMLAQIVNQRKWFPPLREAVQAFVESTQENVTDLENSSLAKETSSKLELFPQILPRVDPPQASQQGISTTTTMQMDSSHHWTPI